MSEVNAVRALYSDPGEPDTDELWLLTRAGLALPAEPRRKRRRASARLLIAAFAAALLGSAVAFWPAQNTGRSRLLAPPSASAATLLRQVAERATGQPDLKPGEFLYSRGTRIAITSAEPASSPSYTYFQRVIEEIWVSLDGTVRDRWTFDPIPVSFPTLKDRRAAAKDTTGDRELQPTDDTTTSPQAFRSQFGLTPGELRDLPTDPTALEAVINRIANERSTPTHHIDPVTVALQLLILPAKPAVKAAVLNALAALPNLRRLPDEMVDGDPAAAIAVRTTDHTTTPPRTYDHVLLIDPASGELLGARYVTLNEMDALSAGTPTSSWTWQQKIVDSIEER
jgi:hypothetical protein